MAGKGWYGWRLDWRFVGGFFNRKVRGPVVLVRLNIGTHGSLEGTVGTGAGWVCWLVQPPG